MSTVLAGERDQDDARSRRDERHDRDLLHRSGSNERRHDRDEDRRRVHRHDGDRDGRELDRQEVERPVRRKHDAEADQAGPRRARASAASSSRSPGRPPRPSPLPGRGGRRRARMRRGRRAATRIAMKPHDAASPASDKFQRIARVYIRSGASTPIRSRQRPTTACVAVQSPSRNASCSDPSTLCWW